TVDEADPGTGIQYEVVLTSQPTDPVSVSLTPDAQIEVAPVGPLVFDAATWDAPLTITITPFDDQIQEDSPHTGVLNLGVTSDDGTYAAVAPDPVNVNVLDNDVAGVSITPAGPIAIDEDHTITGQ